MKFASVKRVESKAVPGVTFVIRRITKRRRDDIDEIVRPVLEKMPAREEYAALCEERGDGALADSEKERRWLELTLQASRLYAREVQPQILRCCLVRIEGLEIEDEQGASHPATLDTLRDCCDDADKLYAELVETVEHERGLTADEAKNSNSPSISAAPEGGSPGNAAPVETPATITSSAA